MATDRYLLDSVILIDHLNRHRPATRFLVASAGSAQITAITYAEVLTGYEDGPARQAAATLLARFPMINIDRVIADLGATLRRTHRWKLPDALQAAAAQASGLRLATRNTKDFPPAVYSWVHVPYVLTPAPPIV